MSMPDDTDTFPPDRKPDQVQQHPDEQDEGTPEAQAQQPDPQPGEAGTILDLKPEPIEGPRALTKAAEMVPVKAHGAAPDNFAHQITLAQYMAKAQLMVPAHFHGNVGDCLAIIDIAQRAGLSPYMVAAKTYKDPAGKGIAFESQLYHAFLIGSGWLKDSALHCEYEGAGDDRTCTVWGTLKTEISPRYYTSPPLKDLRPAKNSNGVYKGSPLWGDKPDVQMFYDTTRDWGRMFCPIATLGMLAQYESIEHPIGPAAGIADIGLRERIQGTKEGAEGHRNGHAEAELAQVAADRGTIAPAGAGTIKPATQTKAKAAPKAAKKKTPDKKPAQKEPDIKATKPTAAQKAAAAKTAASAAADRAQATSDKNKAKQKATEPAKVPTEPKSEAEYQVYCIDWINKIADPEKALDRWGAERDMRERCGVRTNMRNDLRFRIETKHGV